ESFRSHLLPVIKNIHGSLQHLDVNTVPVNKNTADVLSQLKQELSEAVKREEYELAATLRDKIKELEKERQGG
ncbi:MAG TPA: UvrB/UvrC motif-containing protein, partial [Clostridia bacterium]|nr:UvrB/UvrC motif-containing protein [Clostridia bacterium]